MLKFYKISEIKICLYLDLQDRKCVLIGLFLNKLKNKII